MITDPDEVREIDVIVVDLDRDRDWSRWHAVPGEVVGTWIDDQAKAALTLVAALPEAEPMRCFIPRYAIRLRRGTVVVAEVAFCFRCRNGLRLPSSDSSKTTTWFTFDPDSEPAQDLLRRFRTLKDLDAAS